MIIIAPLETQQPSDLRSLPIIKPAPLLAIGYRLRIGGSTEVSGLRQIFEKVEDLEWDGKFKLRGFSSIREIKELFEYADRYDLQEGFEYDDMANLFEQTCHVFLSGLMSGSIEIRRESTHKTR